MLIVHLHFTTRETTFFMELTRQHLAGI